MIIRPLVVIALTSLVLTAGLHAQSPPAKPPPAPGAATAEKPAAAPARPAPPPPQEAYTYEPDGRRDPFISLLGTGAETPTGKKTDGPAGMSVAEISVRGILQSRGALVAMISGPDNKTYIVHQGDKLRDGTIKTITPEGLIVVVEVNDPLSLVKQREVSKLLRGTEGPKE
jgi:type IV pilus assembly protein PilP